MAEQRAARAQAAAAARANSQSWIKKTNSLKQSESLNYNFVILQS
jgi:hypothetical protein